MNELTTKVMQAIPAELTGWVNRHIRWVVEPRNSTAYARLTSTGYEIGFNPDFVAATPPAELTGVWLHEIAHILRGDLLVDLAQREDGQLYYQAMEFCINDALLPYHPLPAGVVTAATLEQMAGEPPPHNSRGARYIYDWLRSRGTQGQPGEMDFESNPDASTEARKAHVEAVLDAPTGLPDGLPEREPLVRAPTSPPRPNTLDISAVAEAAARLAHRARTGGVKIWQRSWARESGVWDTLRGYHKVPRARVIAAMDASGSMTDWIPIYWNLVAELRQLLNVETWVWADTAAMWEPGAEQPYVGGGTSLTPLLGALAHENALIIVFTDGELTDAAEAAAAADGLRLVWALVPGGTAPFEVEETIQLESLK